jgi:hypothetical protein
MARYLATLIPTSALIVLIGLNLLNIPNLTKFKSYKPAIVAVFVIFSVISPFTQRFFPFEPNNEELIVKQMADYFKTNFSDNKKVCYLHPMFPFYAEMDPYNTEKVVPMMAGNHEFVNQLPDSTLFLWDSHFMDIEGKISFEWLSKNPNLIMLKHIRFINEKLPFETCLFIRGNNPDLENVPVEIVYADGLFLGEHNTDKILYSIKNDSLDFLNWFPHVISFSKRNAIEFSQEMEFGPKFNKKSSEINLGKGLKSVNLKFNINQEDSLSELISVIEVRSNDSIVSWEGLLVKQSIIPDKWNLIDLLYNYPEPIKNDDLSITIYIWNKGKQEFYIDDFQIIFEAVTGKN